MGTIRDQQLLARSDRLARDHRVPTRLLISTVCPASRRAPPSARARATARAPCSARAPTGPALPGVITTVRGAHGTPEAGTRASTYGAWRLGAGCPAPMVRTVRGRRARVPRRPRGARVS